MEFLLYLFTSHLWMWAGVEVPPPDGQWFLLVQYYSRQTEFICVSYFTEYHSEIFWMYVEKHP
jgi:hypothetical protein